MADGIWTRITIATAASAVAGLYALGLSGLLPSETWLRPSPSWRLPGAVIALDVSETAELTARLAELGYETATVAAPPGKVPRLVLARLPSDFADDGIVGDRKDLFIRALLPLVLEANRRIAADRARLNRLLRGAELTAEDRTWLKGLAARYGARPGDPADLLRRVDGVPPSLVLAQAAIESGWGRSRFALRGNALFGQWTWDPGGGMTPAARDENSRHEVARFDTLLASVEAYMLNLNRHPAYAEFRSRRALRRAAGLGLTGPALAAGLAAYSELGRDYVALVQTVIDQNGLAKFDAARLAGPAPDD